MNYLDNVFNDYNQRLSDVVTIGDINEELVEIAVQGLKSLHKDVVDTGKFGGLRLKIERQIKTYDQVALIPSLASKYPIIKGQIIVLTVGAIEAFLGDIFRSVANNEPQKLVWQDPNEKISFEPVLLSSGFTLGDAMIGHLKNKNYSFQDLRSSLDAIEKYLGCKVELNDTMKDDLILAASLRNVIVHNQSVIDQAFLKQVRNTAYRKLYSLDEKINITDDYIKGLDVLARSFGQTLVSTIKKIFSEENE